MIDRRLPWKHPNTQLTPKHTKKHTYRSEYALAGDVVNLAARLAAASEKGGDGVLCDETTIASLTGEVRVKNARAAFDVLEL